jgi:predicted phage terminase large subunit-like protein
MKPTSTECAALLRVDPYAFIERAFRQLHPTGRFLHNWHLEAMAAALEDCRRGKTRRLIINLPPRSLKSIAVSVAFPAYWLGHDPSARIICASYGQDLANKHSLDCRTIMTSDWYQRLFRTRLSTLKQSIDEFTTTSHGFRMATSVGGVLTGRGADVLILDDILKPEEALSDSQRKRANDWYSHTLYSRLDNKQTGAIIIVQQRLHEDDLVGHVLEQENWRVLRFPAIAEEDEVHLIETPYGKRRFVREAEAALHPQREPIAVLENMRRTLGEYNFAGQYQQTPAPLGGGLVKREWFRTYAPSELPEKLDQIVQSWDTANKAKELANYSVCTTWGRKGKHVYLLNVYRKQVDFPNLVRAALEQQKQFNARVVLIEDAASGVQLVQQLQESGIYFAKAMKPEGDKVMRMHAQSTMIENGFVHVPKETHWLEAYLHEISTFPASKNSDQVDSTSQALAWMAAEKPVDSELMTKLLRDETERLEQEQQERYDWSLADADPPWDR